MVEMAGKEYLLRLRKEQTKIREDILRLFNEKEQLTFQEIYSVAEEMYHRHCPFPYERDQILEGVVKNQIAVLVNQKRLLEVETETGMEYVPVKNDGGQKITHAA